MAGAGAKSPQEIMKDKMANAAKGRVERLVSEAKLRNQYSRTNGMCLQNDWDSLARALGLHHGDIPALRQMVSSLGLSEPKRLKVKNKG